MNGIIELTKETFQKTVTDGPDAVLVDFWAPWCGPCRMITPELEALSTQVGGRVTIAKVNVDEQPELAEAFGIQSIPNLILFRKGRPVRQFVGFMDRNQLAKALDEAAR